MNNWISNPYYTKEQYDNFVELFKSDNKEELDLPAIVYPNPETPTFDEGSDWHAFCEMVEKDTGLKASIHSYFCVHCGRQVDLMCLCR